jgi:glucosylceramidase
MSCTLVIRLRAVFASAALAAMVLAGLADRSGAQRPAGTAAPRPTTSVSVWLTTADRSHLVSRQRDLHLRRTVPTSLPTIEIDPTVTYQRMVGFGAAFTDASVHLIQTKLSDAQREALLQELFGRSSALGLSFARIPMGATDFSLGHYSYDDLPAGETDSALTRFSIDVDRAEKLPVIRRAVAINPQLTLVASPWSPPAWMKSSGKLAGGTLEPRWYGTYAQYFVRLVQAYQDEGIPIAAVTIQNEPAHEPADYPGARLDAPTRATFIGRHLGPAFEAAKLKTEIWEWDHNWDKPEEPLAVLADSSARRHVAAVAWHCYAGDVDAQATVHAAHPDKDAYFTECSGGAWAPDFGDNLKWNVARLIIGATRGWARGVALWNLALDETHGPHTGGCGNCRGVVTIRADGTVQRNEEYFALAHASRFVRPGAWRIASTAGVEGLPNVAFRNSDDGSVALIVLNESPRPRTFVARMEGRAFRYTMPAGAVTTFIWRSR